MIPKELIKKCLYFDIETSGLYPTLDVAREKNPKLAELWSKRCKWLRLNSGPEFKESTDAELWIEKASLHPEFGQVICFSSAAYNTENNSIKKMSLIGEEKKILLDVNKIFMNCKIGGMQLAGHSIKNFDIPFIGKRMIVHGIKPAEIINSFGKKPWEMTHLDIAEISSFGAWGQGHTSLELMCCSLGIKSPKDDISGEKVHGLFWTGNIKEIEKYCEGDVRATIEVFEKYQS